MNKKSVVRVSGAARLVCNEVVKKLKGRSEKIRRAQVLLKADADGPGWTDAKLDCECLGTASIFMFAEPLSASFRRPRGRSEQRPTGRW